MEAYLRFATKSLDKCNQPIASTSYPLGQTTYHNSQHKHPRGAVRSGSAQPSKRPGAPCSLRTNATPVGRRPALVLSGAALAGLLLNSNNAAAVSSEQLEQVCVNCFVAISLLTFHSTTKCSCMSASPYELHCPAMRWLGALSSQVIEMNSNPLQQCDGIVHSVAYPLLCMQELASQLQPQPDACGWTQGQMTWLTDPPDYSLPGPFTPAALPRLEHTCSTCFPACTGTSCLVKVDVLYPKVRCGLGESWQLERLDPTVHANRPVV